LPQDPRIGVSEGLSGSRRGLFINSLGIFASRVATTLVAFICIPIVVGKLGIAGFGTWESIVAVSILCNIFQATISGTVLWLASNAYGAGDLESIRKHARMAVGTALILAGLLTPLAWAGRHFLIGLFKVPAEFAAAAAWIFPCVVGLMLLGTVNEIVVSLIAGYQRAGLAVIIQAGSVIVNNIVVIIGLALGAGFWSLLAGYATQFLVSGFALFLAARKIIGPINLLPRLPSRDLLVKVAPYAGFLLLGSFSLAFRDQADKVILSSVASPVWTGYYGIAARLAGLVAITCTFFYVPTIAASGALFASDDGPGLHRIYDDVIIATSFLVGLVVVLVAGLHDRLVVLWLGKSMPEVGGILYLLLIGNTIAIILTGTGTSVCKGMGIVRIEMVYIIVGLGLNVLFKAVLVPLIGAVGTVVSSSASWALSSVVFVIILHRQTRLPASSTFKAVKTLLNILICAAIARGLSAALPAATNRLSVLFLTMGLAAASTLVFTLGMTLSGVLSRDDFRRLGRFAKARLRGGPADA
jgi:O-antigen/teichoic acid export membrane protein